MAQPVLAPTRATRGPSSTRPDVPRVEVARPAPRGVEFLLDAAALDPTTIALAAARADVVRLVHSAALPTPAAVRALVSVLEDEIRAVGRDRAEVRVVLEVETVVAADEADAARRRTAVAYAEAFSGVTWSPSATWLVAPRDRVLRDAADLAARTGVDTVALALVGSSARHAGSLVR
ncbi:LLM class flavin-dependent oxidoreductase [Cellulomonas iranensis]|uniref:LLM class flavin-dependent oxidoreductase n=1 Tax=Cellulomonas iranensis TaxID=76862 RepID=UPI0013D8C94F|nr:LLM class flavin-dependent oxidoreductase [Cellulomonas iranensis]